MDGREMTAAPPASAIIALRELPIAQRLLGLYEYGLDGCDRQSDEQVRAVIEELIGSLDFNFGDITEGFARVYGYCLRKVAESDFDRVAWILRELRDTWARALLEAVPAQYDALGDLPKRLESILTDPASCTDRSAEILTNPCSGTAADTDRDGLSDVAETALDDLVAAVVAGAPASDARSTIEKISFDPAKAFTTSEGSTPVPDLDNARVLVTDLGTIERDLRLTTQNLDKLLPAAQAGLAAVITAQEQRLYAIDIVTLAAEAFDGNVTQAQRAVGLYNAYCARCHTAGYSAGIAFTQDAGSGAMGPSLREGRAVVQFPDIADHYDFVVKGSSNGAQYGVNGIGRGWMPGFGAMLSGDDIMLIVRFERTLR